MNKPTFDIKNKSYISILALVCISAIVLSIALYRGIYAPFTSVSDADSIYVAQALMFNSGLPQTYFDHTGYIYILVLSKFFSFLYWLGIIHVDSMLQLFRAKDFFTAFADLIYAGRYFSMLS